MVCCSRLETRDARGVRITRLVRDEHLYYRPSLHVAREKRSALIDKVESSRVASYSGIEWFCSSGKRYNRVSNLAVSLLHVDYSGLMLPFSRSHATLGERPPLLRSVHSLAMTLLVRLHILMLRHGFGKSNVRAPLQEGVPSSIAPANVVRGVCVCRCGPLIHQLPIWGAYSCQQSRRVSTWKAMLKGAGGIHNFSQLNGDAFERSRGPPAENLMNLRPYTACLNLAGQCTMCLSTISALSTRETTARLSAPRYRSSFTRMWTPPRPPLSTVWRHRRLSIAEGVGPKAEEDGEISRTVRVKVHVASPEEMEKTGAFFGADSGPGDVVLLWG